MNKGYLFVVGIIIGIIIIFAVISVKNKKNRAKWSGLAERELWIGERKPLTGRHTLCLLYTSPSPRDAHESRMPSSA